MKRSSSLSSLLSSLSFPLLPLLLSSFLFTILPFLPCFHSFVLFLFRYLSHHTSFSPHTISDTISRTPHTVLTISLITQISLSHAHHILSLTHISPTQLPWLSDAQEVLWKVIQRAQLGECAGMPLLFHLLTHSLTHFALSLTHSPFIL